MKQLYLLLLFLLPFLVASQIPHFSKVYKDSTGLLISSTRVVSNYSGGAFIAGSIEYPKRAILFNVDEAGEIIWSKLIKQQYDSTLIIYDMIRTFDSCLVITGRFQEGKGLCLKLDTLGNEIWHRGFEYNWELDGNTHVVETLDSSYAIIGSSLTNQDEIEILKVDNTGQVLWKDVIRLSANKFRATGILETTDGGLLITGTSDYVGAVNGTLIKLSALGTFEWCRKINEVREILGTKRIADTIISIGKKYNQITLMFMDENAIVHRSIGFLSDSLYPDVLDNPNSELTQMDLQRIAFSSNSWGQGSSVFVLSENGEIIENRGFVMDVTGQCQASDGDMFIIGNGIPFFPATNQICLKRISDTMTVILTDVCMVDHIHTVETIAVSVTSFTNVSSHELLAPPLNIIIEDYLTLEAFDQCVDTNYVDTSAVGILDLELEIFPTLSDGLFHIKGEVSIDQVKVWKSTGELIYNKKFDYSYIDLRGNNSGLYFYACQTIEGRIARGKLIIAN